MAKRSTCSSCGMTAEGEQKFCSVCGGAMNVSDIPEVNETPAADPIPSVMQDAMNGSADGIPPVSSSSADSASYNDDVMNGGSGAGTSQNSTGSFGSYSSYGTSGSIPNINTYNTYNTTAPKKSGKDGLAIGGLITGIASIVLCCFNCLDIPVAIVGLVISILGLKSETKKGCAIGGIITSIAGLLLSILLLVLVFTTGAFEEYTEVYDEVYEEMYDDMYSDDIYDYEYNYDYN